MQIGTTPPATALTTTTGTAGAAEESGADYRALIEELYPAEPYRSRDEINAADVELQNFRDALTGKGALRFIIEFNMEKIEKLVDEYRQKLEAYAVENPDYRLNIEDLVTAFRKQLMEQLMSDDEEKAAMINPERAVSDLLGQPQQSAKGPLEALLQDDDNTVLI